MSESNVENLVVGELATARLGRTTVHGRVVGLPANGTNFPLVAIQPDGATVSAYVDCWINEGWTFTRDDPHDFDGDTSPEALDAWARYSVLPINVALNPWETEQDAFTAGFDLASKRVNA